MGLLYTSCPLEVGMSGGVDVCVGMTIIISCSAPVAAATTRRLLLYSPLMTRARRVHERELAAADRPRAGPSVSHWAALDDRYWPGRPSFYVWTVWFTQLRQRRLRFHYDDR
uniref:Uncharacterized protein n=1 Tax=Mycena chlorophos TaxID=658473 RepID=A0ABQ0LPJ4_MYCCL|nr:predicted protein [Mycena chlorophos]